MKFLASRFSVLCFGLGLCVGGPAVLHAETLDKSVETALLYHPSVESAKQEADIVKQERKEQFSGYFPHLSVTGTGGRIYGDNATSRGLSTTRGAGYSYLWEGSFTARQMLFDGFRTSSMVDSADARKAAADLNIIDVRENLALNTVRSYIDLQRTQKALDMFAEQAKKVDDYIKRIGNAVDEGAADESELQQANDIRVVLDGLIDDYENQKRTAQAYYFELTGRLPEDELEQAVPRKDLLPEDLAEAVGYARENHPLLKAAVFTADSSKYDTDAEKSSLFPTVDGELSYLKTDKADIIGGEVEDARAVMRLNWNFDVGGGQIARIKQRRHQYQESLSKMNELKRQIERGVRLAYSDYKLAVEQLDNQERRRTLNYKLFETYKTQFEGARITLVQLLQSDNQLFTANLEKMNGEYRVLAAQYAALASMGRLQESLNINLADNSVNPPLQANEQK